MNRSLVVLALFALTACDPNLRGGAPCEVTGDGFTRRDPCEFTCVEWDVTCADGTTIVPDVCSTQDCTADASVCPIGTACAAINMTDRECLPADICPTGFTP